MHDDVRMPSSKVKEALAEILHKEGYTEGYQVADNTERPGRVLHIKMKYSPERARVISGLRRVSKPGLRVYSRSEEHTSELQSLMRISYAVFCLKQKKYT